MRAEIEQAVSLVQQGRPGAVEQALGLLQKTVFSFSMKVCGHREDAEDTMQDVLLKSIPYLPKFDSPKALVVWLYTVAKNRCLMKRRRSKFAPRENLSLDELMPDRQELERYAAPTDGSPETAVLRGENAELVHQAVLKLAPPYRLILVLHDMEELSTTEIAKVTGLREGTVRVRLHRARLFVRKELSKLAKPGKQGAHRHPPAAHQPTRGCKNLFAALSDYLDETLDDEMCAKIEQHLQGCAPCEAFLASLEETVQQIRQYESDGVDPQKAAELRRKLLTEYQRIVSNLKAAPTRS